MAYYARGPHAREKGVRAKVFVSHERDVAQGLARTGRAQRQTVRFVLESAVRHCLDVVISSGRSSRIGPGNGGIQQSCWPWIATDLFLNYNGLMIVVSATEGERFFLENLGSRTLRFSTIVEWLSKVTRAIP
jgi:hypothetical protein